MLEIVLLEMHGQTLGSRGDLPGSWRVEHDRVSPELAKELYPKVLQLSAKNVGPAGISKQLSSLFHLSISPGTIRHWIVGDRNPHGRAERNLIRPGPSPELSYIIGANIGDGCTLTKNWIVKLEVTDLDFAEAFNFNMASLFSRKSPNKIIIKRFKVERLPMYVVRYASKLLVEILRLPLKRLLDLAFAFPREFLRGFFDAEGYVSVSIKNGLGLRIGANNSNLSLLSKVKRALDGLGIQSRIESKRKAGTVKVIRGKAFTMKQSSNDLVVSKISSIRKYATEIGFSIHRKGEKLNDAISIVDTYGARRRPEAWKRRYLKIRGEWVRQKTRP